MLGVVGILLSLGLIMYLAYRGVSVLLLGPALAILAALFTANSHPLGLYTQVFMNATGSFIITFFPLFLLGAVFGKLMDDSGAAQAIAHAIVKSIGKDQAPLAIVLSCAVLTYGGVSLFVVAFAIYPIASKLFIHTDIPKRLIPATIALGAFTFTMTALPGSPAIQNTIPMPTFGTDAFAAPGLGVIAAIIMLVAGLAWIQWEVRKAKARGEGYELAKPRADHPHRRASDRDPNASRPENCQFHRRATDVAPVGQETEEQLLRRRSTEFDPIELHHHALGKVSKARVAGALLPIFVVLIANYFFSNDVIPNWNVDYLHLPMFGGVALSNVLGVWATLLALLCGIVVLIIGEWTHFPSVRKALESGANASVLPIFNTASMVGFGAVIAALPAFAIVRDYVLALNAENPLVTLGISVNILAGITGSASGGLSISLHTLGDMYLRLADSAGISRELLHRVTTIATGGLDMLPHNGAVITLLGISGLTHRQAYKDLFFAVVPGPLAALIVVIALGTAFGSF